MQRPTKIQKKALKLEGFLVRVEWTDIAGLGGWQDKDVGDKIQFASCVSWGLLVKCRTDGLVVAGSMGVHRENSFLGDVTYIPWANVNAVWELKADG